MSVQSPIGSPLNEEFKVRPITLEKLTDKQADTLEFVPWHLEAWHDDINRLRVVLDDGSNRKGPWFSSFWEKIAWKQFWPQGETK